MSVENNTETDASVSGSGVEAESNLEINTEVNTESDLEATLEDTETVPVEQTS